MLNPVHHGSNLEQIDRYKVEPYVMSADIYATPPHTGRGGWTWYTGAAGWMYRLSVETLLGLQLEANQLHIAPCVPADWDAYKIHYRYHETLYHITVKHSKEKPDQVGRIIVDGVVLDGAAVVIAGRSRGTIPLVNDLREHQVEVELG